MKKGKIYVPGTYALLILFISLSPLVSCSKKSNNNSLATPPDTSGNIHSYLALGDSYTIGQSVAISDRFPNQVVKILQTDNIHISDPKIIATTGWTTHNLIAALDADPPQNNYSFVSLLIGVNNQYQGRTINEYKAEFTLLLNRAISYAGNNKSRVFVLSIPDYSVTPFAASSDTARIAREIDAFNQVNKDISTLAGVKWIDITGISREAKSDPLLIAGDGLHPSGKQYSKWANLLALFMKQAL